MVTVLDAVVHFLVVAYKSRLAAGSLPIFHFGSDILNRRTQAEPKDVPIRIAQIEVLAA
jgi:hypothetical protein